MYKRLDMDCKTMNKPFVSVIIPNYCHARYLDERLTSVLNQTYPHFEIIILDDCSPDNGASKAVIEKYRKNPHVSHIVYNEVNSGSPFKQWHKGFDLAKGDYIWIAESDDSCDCHFLEVLTKIMTGNSQCTLALCRSVTIDSEGYKTGVHYTQKEKDKAINMDGRSFISKEMQYANLVCNASSALFRKDVLSEIKQDYTDYKACGDWLFWIYIMEHGDVSYTPLMLNYYRMHDTNTTEKCIANGISDHELFLITKYLYDQGYISKRNLMRVKAAHYDFRKFRHPFDNKNTVLLSEKEWGYSSLTWLIVKYDHLLDKIIKMMKRLII